ncbi:MAG: glycerate kinase [Chloroflexota bacterium]
MTLPAAARRMRLDAPDRRPLPAPRLARGRGAGDRVRLSKVARDERDAPAATTLGTGQVLAAASGSADIVLGLGSATTDGGAGLLVALGARLDAAGEELPMGEGAARGPGAGRPPVGAGIARC